jgi:hypothetical protein
MTADAARFDPTVAAAMSSDPAELPPDMREYNTWLLSNVGDPATVHDSQEAHQRAMRQPTVSGPDTTWLPACASCGLCTPPLEVAERRLSTQHVSAFSVDEAVEFAASSPLRQLDASPLAVGESRYFLHPELVTVRLPHPAGAADAGAGAAPDAASAGLAPPPARASFHSPTARTTTPQTPHLPVCRCNLQQARPTPPPIGHWYRADLQHMSPPGSTTNTDAQFHSSAPMPNTPHHST